MISNPELKFINFFETLQQKVFDNQTYQTDTSIIQIISQKYNETPLYLSAICFLRNYCTNPLDPILEQILQTYITDLPNSSRSFLSSNNPTNIRFLQYFLAQFGLRLYQKEQRGFIWLCNFLSWATICQTFHYLESLKEITDLQME